MGWSSSLLLFCFFENSILLAFLVDSNDTGSPRFNSQHQKVRPSYPRGRKPWVKSWVTVYYWHGHRHTKDVKASDMQEIGKMLPIWPCSRERTAVSSGVPARVFMNHWLVCIETGNSNFFPDVYSLWCSPIESSYGNQLLLWWTNRHNGVPGCSGSGNQVHLTSVILSPYLSVCLSFVHSFYTRNQVSWTQT